jgi:hypothetical protein
MNESPTTLRVARDTTIDTLCQRFAEETLTMAELERRLEKARSARSRAELDALLADLQPKAVVVAGEEQARQKAPATRPATRPARDARPDHGDGTGHLAFAIMAGTTRKGQWKPTSNVTAVAIMGGVELDFRDAVLEPGGTEINCFAFWGGVEIIVPPDVNVESQGFAFMGGFEQSSNIETRATEDAPTIRVNGFALMGGVDIKVKERGSSSARKLGKGRG